MYAISNQFDQKNNKSLLKYRIHSYHKKNNKKYLAAYIIMRTQTHKQKHLWFSF